MTRTIEKLEATAQLDRAASAVSEALAKAQDASGPHATSGNHQEIATALAACLQNIQTLKTEGLVALASPKNIRTAMSRLREVMTQLQTSGGTFFADDSLRIIARALAVLYPVSTLIEQLSEAGAANLSSRSSAPPVGPDAELRDRRSTFRQTVEVEIGLHADTNFFTGLSEDISAGGLFVSTYDVLPIGTKVNVNFSLPSGRIFSIDGVVRWTRELNELTSEVPPGMGIQFDSLDEEDAAHIHRYMSDFPPMYYE